MLQQYASSQNICWTCYFLICRSYLYAVISMVGKDDIIHD